MDALTLDAADRAAPFEIRDVQLMGAEALARRYRTLRVFDEPAALASCCGWFGRPEEMLTRYLRAYAESFFARHDRLLKDRGLDQTQSPEEAVRLLSDLRGRYRAILQRNLGLDALRALVDCDIDYSSESRNGRFNWYSVGCIDRREDGYVVEKKLLRLYDQVYTPLLFFRAPEQGSAVRRFSTCTGTGVDLRGRAAVRRAHARRGYNVCITEPAGQNERSVCSRGNDYHGGFPGAVTNLVGVAEMALQMLDAMQVLSYLCARPDVDVSRIGATGGSGGGQQSMLLLALDDRVAAAGLSSTPYIAAREYFLAHFCTGEAVPGWIAEMDENLLLAAQAPALSSAFTPKRTTARPSLERMSLPARARAGGLPPRRMRGRLCVAVHSSYHGYPQQARDIACGFFDRVFLGVGTLPVPEEGMPALCRTPVTTGSIQTTSIPSKSPRSMRSAGTCLPAATSGGYRQEPAEQKEDPARAAPSSPARRDVGAAPAVRGKRRDISGVFPPPHGAGDRAGRGRALFPPQPGRKETGGRTRRHGQKQPLGRPVDRRLSACRLRRPAARPARRGGDLLAHAAADRSLGRGNHHRESGEYLALQDSELHNTRCCLEAPRWACGCDLDGLIRFAAEELGFHTLSSHGAGGLRPGRSAGGHPQCASAASCATARRRAFFHSCAAGVFGFHSQMDPLHHACRISGASQHGKADLPPAGREEENSPTFTGGPEWRARSCRSCSPEWGIFPTSQRWPPPSGCCSRRPMDLDGRYLDWSRAANLFVHAQRAYRAAGAEDRLRLCHFLNAYSLPLTARECVGEFIRRIPYDLYSERAAVHEDQWGTPAGRYPVPFPKGGHRRGDADGTVPPDHDGPLSHGKHERMAEIYRRMAELLRQKRDCIQYQYGHGGRALRVPVPQDHRKLPFGRFVGDDLKERSAVYCITDPAWQDYTARVCPLCPQPPEKLMIDDDFRSLNHTARFGCFCENHARLVSERLGEPLTSRQLLDFVCGNDEKKPACPQIVDGSEL